MRSICTRSISSSVLPPFGSSTWNWKEKSAGRISLPRPTTSARSTAFSNSLTLPGQSCRISTSMASCESCGTGRLVAMQNLFRKCATNSGMSSRRSRNGGSSMRQILNEVAKQLYGSRPFTPVLDRTISFLGQYIPGRAEEMERKLLSEGLSAVPFRLEGLIRAAELLGRTPPFSLIQTKMLRLVHRRPGTVIKNIVRAGHLTIGQRGTATIGDVFVCLRDADREGGPAFVEDVLSAEEDFHWLDPAGLCFWLSSVARNPMVRRIRKILSVANPVRIAALQAGIARDYRMRGYLAPRGVLLELCQQIKGLQVDADVVRAVPPISRNRVLVAMEKQV